MLGIIPISSCTSGMQHIVGKFSTRATTLFRTSSQSEVCTQSYGAPKLRESQLWQFRTKCHLDVDLVERHRVYYKGEGGDFPQVRPMVNLVNLKLPVARPGTKSAQTMH
jgi:hypothetical protein